MWTTFVKNVCVSTVALPVHPWGVHDDRYETLVVPAKGKKVTSWMELTCERYSNKLEAWKGHQRLIGLIKSGAWDQWCDNRIAELEEIK